jgi:HEAT repeat protein
MPPASRSLQDLLASLVAGNEPSAVELTALSDLERDEVDEVRSAWPGVPASFRADVLSRVAELAEDNVDLDFTRFARVGLSDSEAEVRRLAIAALWECRDPVVGARLGDILRGDDDAAVRAAAASALEPFVLEVELGHVRGDDADRFVGPLREVASDGDSADLRARAIESLAPLSQPWVDSLITDAYYDDDRRLRLAAVRAMGGSARETWTEYLDEQARSDDPEFRFEAATALGTIASEEGLPALEDLLDDEDSEVVLAAVRALGEIGGEEATDILERFMVDAEDNLRDEARDAIDRARFADDEDLMRHSERRET